MRLGTLFIAIVLIAALFVAAVILVIQPKVTPVPSEPPEVSPTRLEAHVKHLSVDLYPRSYDRMRNIERAAQYILQEFKAAGGDVTVQDVMVDGVKFKNIIAHYGPKSGPVMVIGAHYDSHGDEEEGAKYLPGFDPQSHTPGADDNASGVAGLLELAYMLGRQQPTQPVELVAYTLEEPPHFNTENMGSVWHARSLKKSQRDVRLMLSLEMIGYFSDEQQSQSYPLAGMDFLYPDRGDFIAIVGKLSSFGAIRKCKALMAGATDLPVYSISAPRMLLGIDSSDHRSYWDESYPAFMVTDTAYFRNPNYHMAGDTYEKLDYRRMAKVVQGVHAVIQKFTN